MYTPDVIWDHLTSLGSGRLGSNTQSHDLAVLCVCSTSRSLAHKELTDRCNHVKSQRTEKVGWERYALEHSGPWIFHEPHARSAILDPRSRNNQDEKQTVPKWDR